MGTQRLKHRIMTHGEKEKRTLYININISFLYLQASRTVPPLGKRSQTCASSLETELLCTSARFSSTEMITVHAAQPVLESARGEGGEEGGGKQVVRINVTESGCAKHNYQVGVDQSMRLSQQDSAT